MEKILLGHGSGGRLMHQLIREHLVPEFNLKELSDSAVIDLKGHSKLAFTTDSYVVSPIFFPGGNIGELAVNGTVNDLSMVGARPLYLSAGFIIEEGFPMGDMKRIISSMAEAAKNAGVRIVAGDTKVVDKGKGDGIFINTSGVGIIHDGIDLGPRHIRAGDKVIISGLMGDHGIAVMSERNGLSFEPPVVSDTAALNGLVERMFDITPNPAIRMMRDPTRGGVATTLKEIANDSGFCIGINEDGLPISSGVIGACELLGLDPLYIANEGILIAVVSPDVAATLVEEMRKHPLGKNSAIIGEVTYEAKATVLLRTSVGGTRIVDMLAGEQLPRIC
ncbi:MAG: hydrogenase expression/formation protein HypE [Nitrospirae bacterium]|nr:hydrogenase expression/formation protein HypE [Nitrospirota bacterium]MCL5977177.1 hydrogenase expression/formation protein HypE [Nitrospirota bacterium]